MSYGIQPRDLKPVQSLVPIAEHPASREHDANSLSTVATPLVGGTRQKVGEGAGGGWGWNWEGLLINCLWHSRPLLANQQPAALQVSIWTRHTLPWYQGEV